MLEVDLEFHPNTPEKAGGRLERESVQRESREGLRLAPKIQRTERLAPDGALEGVMERLGLKID
jgi:hypothetical protein